MKIRKIVAMLTMAFLATSVFAASKKITDMIGREVTVNPGLYWSRCFENVFLHWQCRFTLWCRRH